MKGGVIIIYLCNSASKTMYNDPRVKEINEPLTEAEFIDIIHKNKVKSAIGHKPIVDCISKIIGKKVELNRLRLNLTYDDIILLVSIDGRLPENPDYVDYKGKIEYRLVRFEKQNEQDILKTQKIIKEITMEA